ncbi:hypothetical protein A3J17_05105 [Candidatus Curtissbacteria bacterium RIFCSPLOWO2_02_FULL_40_11]|uniref:General secretion pathway GspH domain-containing protein n=2 Tax=Candidatus Curtissiibacteriota TaxID=1752717 RepID=A0A1F5G8E2_9BACT|nr:MAG: hypothetical protein A2775_00130 [Candidatus Curtissbacteria bacterium RIFCSPHIGHO2_01_FULL_39_57]OGD88128.1 MAG: hypothetical protein A3D04_01510 [Candidatus Curtissbacteria bacterium RIFCSPHIGHO2_02_FULL_40_16b]OGE00512.1 MAG: hypothetical protein A3J17_05105 [Candidatus Curtissbacteria bacterium RIFCSPLOWO2_02_FULL_40_11]OGE13237.1 MAG: hypothetical protein A3G14_00490 [Candidatus Curtissbacteria bacterium RIFCSPLOWO2_12_FULL_38_9]
MRKLSTLNSQLSTYNGFTLIEILLVMAIIAIITSYATINLLRPQISASLESTTTQISSDIKGQQLKSMAGDSEGAGTSQIYGVRFEADRYILFRGAYPSPSDFTVNLEPSVLIVNSPQEFSFAKRSGETSAGNVVIEHIQSGDQKTLSINKFGAITIN